MYNGYRKYFLYNFTFSNIFITIIIYKFLYIKISLLVINYTYNKYHFCNYYKYDRIYIKFKSARNRKINFYM